jgi:hypothetical protein
MQNISSHQPTSCEWEHITTYDRHPPLGADAYPSAGSRKQKACGSPAFEKRCADADHNALAQGLKGHLAVGGPGLIPSVDLR